MTTVQVRTPAKIASIFEKPRGVLRYRGAKGGRGSGKSYNFAKMAAIFGMNEKLKILCCREIQRSIKDSFHMELKGAIESEDWLESQYDVGVDFIRGKNGTEFIFKGLYRNLGSVKSISNIDICIVEEAEDVSNEAWIVLEPTIRKEKSEIWVIWNPKDKKSPVNKKFVIESPPRSCFKQVNWDDNPFFPSVLEEKRRHDLSTLDHALYKHIWEGDYLELSEAQVFKDKYEIKYFEIDQSFGSPYHGLDFGFSQDPTFGTQLYIKDNTLYIRREASKVRLELNDTADFLKNKIPDIEKYVIRADCSRPESISYLKNHGLPSICGVKKGPGSVEDGIAFIKSFDKIIIHPDCPEIANEFVYYSYKKDPRTGDILPVIIDAHNHGIDSIRYAIEPMTKGQFTVTIL